MGLIICFYGIIEIVLIFIKVLRDKRNMDEFNEKYESQFTTYREIKNYVLKTDNKSMLNDYLKIEDQYRSYNKMLYTSIVLGILIIIISGIVSTY